MLADFPVLIRARARFLVRWAVRNSYPPDPRLATTAITFRIVRDPAAIPKTSTGRVPTTSPEYRPSNEREYHPQKLSRRWIKKRELWLPSSVVVLNCKPTLQRKTDFHPAL